jgi:hypothetical protein
MQFLGYLKNLTPLCENKPEMISLARIRLRYRKQPRTGDLLITGGPTCNLIEADDKKTSTGAALSLGADGRVKN